MTDSLSAMRTLTLGVGLSAPGDFMVSTHA